MVHFGNLKKEALALEQIIENWRNAWEKKEIERYMSFYTFRFVSENKNWNQYRTHMERVAKTYKNIEVKINNLRLVKNNGLVVAIFDQDFITERLRSRGKKKLYLQQNSKQWKIIREAFTLVEKRWFSPPKAPLFDPQEIRD
jgi:hypothetical protein